MLSKNQIKLIKSLSQKKYRRQHQLFTVEGVKGITEFLESDFVLHQLFTTKSVFNSHISVEISETELKKISALTTPNTALAVFKIPDSKPINNDNLILALDAVRDPGNLGTIIRLCDWFGITDLVCSMETVDCFNTKVVQSTMGSLSRVNVTYTKLKDFLNAQNAYIIGTFMEGENIYDSQLPNKGVIVLGNEAKGISTEIKALTHMKISIPRYGALKATESLNVATAASIVLSEFKRRTTEM
ncbi:RNA methyltransferase [Ichthyenterobacterium sp. W332]|uniref:RNA methyltransferase n=1 Tax=Microcosmobacter mediterraneus TaxID=3075607 RepID=A0ABU2YQM2_9FLAO|nr:RNA methyltransferase [Ichthyenterobacterium sp. W332]MDT0559363.1 RNA methyltransferase [Ichthyenterobacterium sp. W332]